jgi:hypothetical protein
MGYREKTGGNFAAESLENGHDSEKRSTLSRIKRAAMDTIE